MPYVNIKITDEGVTPERKAEIISGVTELLERYLILLCQIKILASDHVGKYNVMC
jgi:4-oxalocrotonate tautomerase